MRVFCNTVVEKRKNIVFHFVKPLILISQNLITTVFNSQQKEMTRRTGDTSLVKTLNALRLSPAHLVRILTHITTQSLHTTLYREANEIKYKQH